MEAQPLAPARAIGAGVPESQPLRWPVGAIWIGHELQKHKHPRRANALLLGKGAAILYGASTWWGKRRFYMISLLSIVVFAFVLFVLSER